MKNNDLNVFTYGYVYWNPLKNIPQFFRNIKYAWQRATKGFCNQDVWNLGDYYTKLIRDSISYFADNSYSYPGDETPEGCCSEAWVNYLNDIAVLMDKSVDRDFENRQYYTNPYEEEFTEYLSRRHPVNVEWLPDKSCKVVYEDTAEDEHIRNKYFEYETKIHSMRKADRDEALLMLKNRWDDLFD